ncbi:hypothetical protein [Halomontanus rarus]|uniref:hypothetical protein n=1 Tax=Halomontanus rarus TaxID=3034020 RepID=UPI001A98A591
MTTTTHAHETISDESIKGKITLERPRPAYGYLGRDGNDNHHHVDRATNTVYVTEHEYERFLPANAHTYWVRVRGRTHTVVDLEFPPSNLGTWIDHVDSSVGWADQPVDLQALRRLRVESVRVPDKTIAATFELKQPVPLGDFERACCALLEEVNQ